MPKFYIDFQDDLQVLQSDISLFFTRNERLLNDYYDVRQHCYSEIEGLEPNFYGGKDEYDEICDTLVIAYKNIIIGGARIIGKTPGSSNNIPMNRDALPVEEIFSDLQLHRVPYCEFNRLAILGGFRSMPLLRRVLQKLAGFAIARGYKYLFSVSELMQARTYRRVFKSLELPNPYEIHENFEVPKVEDAEYAGLEMFVSSMAFPQQWNGIQDRSNLWS